VNLQHSPRSLTGYERPTYKGQRRENGREQEEKERKEMGREEKGKGKEKRK